MSYTPLESYHISSDESASVFGGPVHEGEPMGIRPVWLIVVAVVTAVMMTSCSYDQSSNRYQASGTVAKVERNDIPFPKAKVPLPENRATSCEESPKTAVKEAPPCTPAPAPAPVLSDIHFDYDKYAIRPADAETLRKNLAWFKANPGRKVRVDGQCDERGTTAYNVDLGRKRANAAKAYLVTLGVSPDLLEVVSSGKDKPAVAGHNREIWAGNRRVHFEPIL